MMWLPVYIVDCLNYKYFQATDLLWIWTDEHIAEVCNGATVSCAIQSRGINYNSLLLHRHYLSAGLSGLRCANNKKNRHNSSFSTLTILARVELPCCIGRDSASFSGVVLSILLTNSTCISVCIRQRRVSAFYMCCDLVQLLSYSTVLCTLLFMLHSCLLGSLFFHRHVTYLLFFLHHSCFCFHQKNFRPLGFPPYLCYFDPCHTLSVLILINLQYYLLLPL